MNSEVATPSATPSEGAGDKAEPADRLRRVWSRARAGSKGVWALAREVARAVGDGRLKNGVVLVVLLGLFTTVFGVVWLVTGFGQKGEAKVEATSDSPQPIAVVAAPPNTSGPEALPVPTEAHVWRVRDLSGDAAVDVKEFAVGKRTVLAALRGEGLTLTGAMHVLAPFHGSRTFNSVNPKDQLTLGVRKGSGKPVAFEYRKNAFEVWQAKEGEDGKFVGKKLELPVVRKKVAVAVGVGEDLRDSVVKSGLDDDVLKMLDDALDGHADLADLRSGARLRVIATEDRVDGEFARYAELNAVEYLPASDSPGLRVYSFPPAGEGKKVHGGYYDAKGRQPYHGGYRSPVPLGRIASRFNMKRVHPVLHVVMPHNGVDFAAPTGTPVYATAAGVVRSAGDGGPCGNMIQLEHPGGLVSAYCHLSRFAPVRPGQHVEGRQLIGYVGQTGRATGPHLHFAFKRGDRFVDPLAFKLDGVRVLPSGDREAFDAVRSELDSALDAVALPPKASSAAAPPAESEQILDEPP